MTRLQLRRALLGAGAAMLLGGPALADFYDGLAAYEHQDYAAAVAEMAPLAAAGDARAQKLLGRLYRDGQGVPQDFVRAHQWLNLAAAAGDADAAKERDELAQRMDPGQIAEAQRLASDTFQPSVAAPTAAPSASTATDQRVRVVDASLLDRARVVDLQWQLAVHGYDPGPADGIAGPRTRSAIRDYQEDGGLLVDGRATPALLEHIQYADPPVRNAGLETPSATDKAYIRAVQEQLAARGYYQGPLHGQADRATRRAIRGYQAANGMAIDGAVTLALVNHLRLIDTAATY